MSASTKKKLRSAERAEKLTQKQLEEQKEAKKLKITTTVFVVAIALMLCFAIVITAVKTVENSGIRERNTVALTLNDHEISNAEMNYYYIDAINAFASQYGSYAALLGLDTTKPLNEQVLDATTGLTWADDFFNSAVENAKGVYALNDAANAAGFTCKCSTKNKILRCDLCCIISQFQCGYRLEVDMVGCAFIVIDQCIYTADDTTHGIRYKTVGVHGTIELHIIQCQV